VTAYRGLRGRVYLVIKGVPGLAYDVLSGIRGAQRRMRMLNRTNLL
jgi:hypothetical protein